MARAGMVMIAATIGMIAGMIIAVMTVTTTTATTGVPTAPRNG
jgi:hypothetical protein